MVWKLILHDKGGLVRDPMSWPVEPIAFGSAQRETERVAQGPLRIGSRKKPAVASPPPLTRPRSTSQPMGSASSTVSSAGAVRSAENAVETDANAGKRRLLNGLKVDELKAKLKATSLPVSGNKAALIERILQSAVHIDVSQ